MLFRLTIRELRKNWFEYLSMFLITLLAVTLFLGFISNSETLRRRAELYYEAVDLPDLVVQTTGFDDADRDYLNGLGEGVSVEYRTYSEGSFVKEGGKPESAKFYVSDGTHGAPYLTEGEAGLLIDARIAELEGFSVGDKVTLSFTSLESAFATQGIVPVFEAEITGLMHSVECVNIYMESAVVVSPALFEEKIFDLAMEKMKEIPWFDPEDTMSRDLVKGAVEQSLPLLQTQAVVATEGDAAALKGEIRSYFAGKAENNLIAVFDHDTMEAVVTIDSEVDQSLHMIYVFPVIFFLVSVLVIMTSISRLILRERTHIGTLKALGLTNRRIVFHYASFSALVTLAGAVLGAVLGPLIVPNVMSIKYKLMFSMPFLCGITVSPLWTLAVLAVVGIAAFLIGVWASRSVIRENPAECMRPKQVNYNPRAGKREGLGANTGCLSLRMAFRNIRVSWGRAIMTVVGIAGCSALLLTSFGIGDTLQASVKNDFGGIFTFDVMAPDTEEVRAALEGTDAERVESVQAYFVSASRGGAGGRDISVYLIEENSSMCSVLSDGAANAISTTTAEDLGVKAGDVVTVTYGSESAEIVIEKVVRTTAWNGIYLTRSPFEASAPTQRLWIGASDPEAVRDAINEAEGADAATTMRDDVGEIENLISSTDTMKYTLMTFAILLSVVVLYNLSLLNVKERTRDMATMKVLGFTHFKIALSLIFEIMFLTLIGTAVGCLLGYPLLYLVMTINRVSVLAFVITLAPVSYVFSALLSLVTAAAINAVFGLLISRISMTESLKSVE